MRKLMTVCFFVFTLFLFCYSVFAAEAVNLAGYGFATCDSYENENAIALAAVDGVVDRYRWRPTRSVKLDSETGLYVSTSGRSAWFQVEFEKSIEITHAKIYWSQERAAKDHYMLFYSDDGNNWNEMSDFSVERNDGSGSFVNPIIDTVTFNPVKAKYYKIELKAGETKDGLGSFYEFELYGDPSQFDYLKKVNKSEDVNNDNNSDDTSGSKFQLGIVDYVAIGVGVAAVAAAAIIVIRVSKKGDGKNA